MSKEIDNFVDEFITELENNRIEREENIKNFVAVFNKKVPTDYKFELVTFDNYVWKSKLPNQTLEVGLSNVGTDDIEIFVSYNFTDLTYFKLEKFPNKDMFQTLLKVLFDLEDKDLKELGYLIEVDLEELDAELDEMFANLK
jgi:hypothetical protein